MILLGQPSSTDGVLVGPSLTEGVLSWSLETIADVLDCFLTALVRMMLWIPEKHKKKQGRSRGCHRLMKRLHHCASVCLQPLYFFLRSLLFPSTV